jgi:hypothetical protein
MGAPVSLVALSAAPVGSLLWQRPPNAPVLTIVCRATFVLQPGEAVLAAEQEPLAAAERPYPDGSSRGIYAPCDLVPMKPAADVVLVGHAFAPGHDGGHPRTPGRQPVRSLVARLTVGEVDKRVEVFCDRHFDPQGALHEGPRFASMPLVYERAACGPDTVNPIGVRPDARDPYGRLALPNLQPMGLEIAAPTDVVAPVCFGPIASTWPSRRALLGATAAAQTPAEWQGPYLPPDLDPSFFDAAPRDQQLQALRGDERIVLLNLHAQHPELVLRLSRIRPRTFVEGLGGAPQAVAMRADTLWFDTSRQIFTITWRGQLPLKGASTGLRALVALEGADHPLGWEDFERLQRVAAAAGAGNQHTTQTVIGLVDPTVRASAMPFAQAERAARTAREPVAGGGLPFRRQGEALPPPLPPPPPSPKEETVDEAGGAGGSGPSWAAGTVEAPVSPAAPSIDSPWAREGSPAMVSTLALALPNLAAAAPPVVQMYGGHDGGSSPSTPSPRASVVAPVGGSAAPRPPGVAVTPPLHLVWFEPGRLRALQKDPRFSPILDALDDRPLDGDLDDPELAADVADVDERREAFEILARGSAIGEEGATAALTGAVRDDGRLVQPLVLVAGELFFPFDELEALKATISAAAPYAGADLEARAMLDLAKEFLGSPGQPSAPAVAEGLATRIRETFEKRGLAPAGFLDAQTGRALLQGRHYQRRSLLGGPHVRALLHTGSGQGIPAYLDHDAAAKLPAVERLRVRMLAVVHPTLDQQETHPAALRAVALGVVIGPPPARR